MGTLFFYSITSPTLKLVFQCAKKRFRRRIVQEKILSNVLVQCFFRFDLTFDKPECIFNNNQLSSFVWHRLGYLSHVSSSHVNISNKYKTGYELVARESVKMFSNK